jgi:hypothetical protein
MKVLPAAGPERTRVLVLIALLAIAGAAWYYMSSSAAPLPLPTLPGRTASNKPATPRDLSGAARPAASQAIVKPTVPEPLKLADLEKVPDEPEAGRNPFRFGVKYVPPPPTPAPVFTPPPVVTPPPPPPPEVKLKLMAVVDDPYVAGRRRGYFVDPTGAMFEAVDGQPVDGRYRVVKVDRGSAIVEFLDGSGRRTLFVGR